MKLLYRYYKFSEHSIVYNYDEIAEKYNDCRSVDHVPS